jgi:hypothetical protein
MIYYDPDYTSIAHLIYHHTAPFKRFATIVPEQLLVFKEANGIPPVDGMIGSSPALEYLL